MRVKRAQTSAVMLLLTSITISSFSASAQPDSTPVVESLTQLEKQEESTVRRKLDWNLEFAGEFEGQGRDESLAVVTGLGLDMNFQFSKSLSLILAPTARFYSARSQQRFDSDSFEDRIYLREGYMNLQPLDGEHFKLGLRAGSISQKLVDQPQLLSSSRSFPAVALVTSYTGGPVTVGLEAEEAVPTSYTYNALREDKEPLPGLRATRASLSAELLGDMKLSLAVGQMSWRNLPARVAFNSQKLGNTPQGELAPTSRFRTGFNTGFVGAQLDYCLDCKIGGTLQGRRARNSSAPDDSADSQMIGIAGHYRTRSLITSIAIDSFFAESDVSPAAYTPSSMGNTNRAGNRLRLEFEIPSMEMTVMTQFVQARTLAPTPYQSDFNSLYLGVETHGPWIQ